MVARNQLPSRLWMRTSQSALLAVVVRRRMVNGDFVNAIKAIAVRQNESRANVAYIERRHGEMIAERRSKEQRCAFVN